MSSRHRDSSREWYSAKAREHISIILSNNDSGRSFCDLGCGFGELLEMYLTNGLNVTLATDLSMSALSAARERLLQFKIKILRSSWIESLSSSGFDSIMSTGALNQYLKPDDMKALLCRFSSNPSLKSAYFFDCINPLHYLVTSSSLRYDAKVLESMSSPFSPKRLLRWILGTYHTVLASFCLDFLRLQSFYLGEIAMGYGHTPLFWRKAAQMHNLRVQFYSSQSYEYRYHVVFSRETQ